MKLFVNGFSAIGATTKEEMASAVVSELKRIGYKVIGQPVVTQKNWSKDIYTVSVPAISKYRKQPIFCVRTFRLTSVEEIESVPFVDLTK